MNNNNNNNNNRGKKKAIPNWNPELASWEIHEEYGDGQSKPLTNPGERKRAWKDVMQGDELKVAPNAGPPRKKFKGPNGQV